MSDEAAISGQQSAVSGGDFDGDDPFPPLSLAPGFSRVSGTRAGENRFNGFPSPTKPLKRFGHHSSHDTRLKPGANEMRSQGCRVFASGGQTP